MPDLDVRRHAGVHDLLADPPGRAVASHLCPIGTGGARRRRPSSVDVQHEAAYALGAQRSDVLRLIAANGLALVGIGIAVGLAAAAGVTRYLGTLVFGVSPTDPPAFAAASALLIAVALVAHWIPVRRALRIDPAGALRAE
jgi:hypothetical protein